VRSSRARRRKPRTIREILHPFSRLISFVGLLIVVATFITKDVLRDNAKDVIGEFESIKRVRFLKSGLNDLVFRAKTTEDLVLDVDRKLNGSSNYPANGGEKVFESLDGIGRTFNFIENSLADRSILVESLPEQSRKNAQMVNEHALQAMDKVSHELNNLGNLPQAAKLAR
jgi:hypothetical protein